MADALEKRNPMAVNHLGDLGGACKIVSTYQSINEAVKGLKISLSNALEHLV